MLTTRRNMVVGSGPDKAARAAAAARAAIAPAQLTLIRNSDVLTMDQKHGELRGCDVLIDKGRIAAIGKAIDAPNAYVVQADGMILMPGMIDGHRHTWETVLAGELVKTSTNWSRYFTDCNYKYGLCFTPEDMHFAQYAGGIDALDSGVTSVVDHCHVTWGDALEDAAARGLKDSGIGGYFCYQMTPTVTYGPGATIALRDAVREVTKADERHFASAERLCKTYFADPASSLQFGGALSIGIGYMTVAEMADEMTRLRKMGAKILTQHVQKPNWPIDATKFYSGLGDLYRAGLLGPDYHCSHATWATEDELRMLRETGAGVCSCCMGEMPYVSFGKGPSVHGRAKAAGIPAGNGVDVPIGLTNDFFEHTRAGFWSLFTTDQGSGFAADYTSTDVLDFSTRMGAKGDAFGRRDRNHHRR